MMLCDKLENWDQYAGRLPASFSEAVAWVKEHLEDLPEPRKYPLNEEGMYVNVQEYFPKPMDDAKFENHHRYIDIQCFARGKERIFWTKPKDFEQTDEYDEEKGY